MSSAVSVNTARQLADSLPMTDRHLKNVGEHFDHTVHHGFPCWRSRRYIGSEKVELGEREGNTEMLTKMTVECSFKRIAQGQKTEGVVDSMSPLHFLFSKNRYFNNTK